MRLLAETELDQKSWDAALINHPEGHFLQSWAWGDFQKSLGNQIWRIAVEENGEITLQLLVIKQSLGFGQFILYSPRGSLGRRNLSALEAQSAAGLVLDQVRRVSTQEDCIFFRIDPPTPDTDFATLAWYRQLGFAPNPSKPIQPKHNQVLDLSEGADKAIAKSKSKTRYNISVAKRHDLVVESSATEDSIRAFLSLHSQTASRQGFTPHSERYLEKQLRFMIGAGAADLVTVWLPDNRTPLSSIFIVYFGQVATYLHGASSHENRNMMAPYLAHDFAIHLAVDRGMTSYDMGGVQPDPNHRWSGITRFKQGFGGQTISYAGTLELALVGWKYRLYRLISKFR